MKKIIGLVLVTVSSYSYLYCQQSKTANTLLWRISGKGLAHPSYLYGTMHLTDKRIFQLGDSLYNALEQTEGFAAELDMNSVGTQMVNYFINEKEEKKLNDPVRLKDAVSPEIWNTYKGKLEKKLGKKADKITVDDLDEIKSRLSAEIFKKGDMPTFLDAWLSGQAGRLGKWVGGIEDFEDQIGHLDDIENKIQLAVFDDDYYRKGIDMLVKLYVAQRLDSIDAMLYREENGRKDPIMIRRNSKMSARIDSLALIRSTLFAVGAAHLPGDSGVIALLRKRGFTVEPVFSSKTISADKYTLNGKTLPWYPVQVPDSAYTLKMPGKAEDIVIPGIEELKMKMFFDMTYMCMYMTASIELPEERKNIPRDTLYKGISERYSRGGRNLKEKPVTINGIDGREYLISTDDGEVRLQIFVPGMERVVLNCVFAFSEKVMRAPESEQFFQSFAYNASAKKKPVTAGSNWTTMEFPLQSFSFQIPLKPKYKKDTSSLEGMVTHSWQAMDMKEQAFYGMTVSALKEDMYDPAIDSVYYEDVKERLLASFTGSKVLDSGHIAVDGYPGYTFSISGKSEGEEVMAKVLLVPRGGMNYYLYSVYSPGSGGAVSADKFMKSFRLLPYGYTGWGKQTAPDNSFTLTAPFPVVREKVKDEENNHPGAERFIVYDSLARVNTYIDKMILPGWLWYNNDTAFLRSRAQRYYLETDSLLEYKTEINGNLKAVTLITVKNNDNLAKKVKIILNGNETYEIFGHYALQDLPAGYNRLYEDFKPAVIKPAPDFTNSGASHLATSMVKADHEEIELIKSLWDDLVFTEKEIPALREMMLKVYPDFDTLYYQSMNMKVYEKLRATDSNYTSVAFFRERYSAVKKEDEYIKPLILAYLTGAQTKEAFSAVKECMVNNPLRIDKKLPYFPHSFYDSLALTSALFPDIISEAGNPALWDLISGITASLMDSSLLDRSVIRSNGSYFITSAKRLLQEYSEEMEEGSYIYEDLIRLLGVIGTQDAKELLGQFARFSDMNIKFRTLIAMLESGMPADTKTINNLAAKDGYRHSLYDELLRLNKVKLFPAVFLSQKMLGQSKLYDYATDEDAPDKIVALGEKVFMYGGKQQKFYLYKVEFSYEESKEYYLGVAGPYPLNLRDFRSSHDVTGVYWEKELDIKGTDKQFRDYLKYLEELKNKEE